MSVVPDNLGVRVRSKHTLHVHHSVKAIMDITYIKNFLDSRLSWTSQQSETSWTLHRTQKSQHQGNYKHLRHNKFSKIKAIMDITVIRNNTWHHSFKESTDTTYITNITKTRPLLTKWFRKYIFLVNDIRYINTDI
jgi:hypothetical protein